MSDVPVVGLRGEGDARQGDADPPSPFCGECDNGLIWDPRVDGNVVQCRCVEVVRQGTQRKERAMHATPDDTLAQWIVVEEAEVNAFVGVDDSIPPPALYDNGYKLAVGENPRVTIEVQRRG